MPNTTNPLELIFPGSLLSEERILIFHEKQEKEDLLNAMMDSLAEDPDFKDREELACGIFHRESLMSTGIGGNTGVPHFRLPDMEKDFVALAICPDGVLNYDSPDRKSIQLVFMVVVGGKKKTEHVRIISAIAKLLSDGKLKKQLLSAEDASTALERIRSAEAQLTGKTEQ